ncbi:MAG: 16S rRNA (guanine(527)-N(7))-methyltransferase RsmG [Clostridiaceae bacterium]|nr:16S rRNA (guanine(527)-N(7))-methyltransferase RsmG [Clostridiaceae bacterium]
MNRLENRNILTDGLIELGVEPSEEKVEKLIGFMEIMLEWNEKVNLTAITEEKEIFIKHFLDSATCLSSEYIKEGSKIIDVGTGAGFPGIPVKILKDGLKMTLLDSLNKRIIYLKEAVKRLDLRDITAVHGRAEEVGSSKAHRESYDIVLSRAVASMNVLCEYCIPFAKIGGFFLCQKGPDIKDEMEQAASAVKILGGRIREVKEYKLPFSDIKHNIIVIEKVAVTPTKYPRKPGKPAANPIA